MIPQRDDTGRRHGLLELGRGLEVCSPWRPHAAPPSRTDRLAERLPLARRALRTQAGMLTLQLSEPASPLGSPLAKSTSADTAMDRLARTAATELRRRCWRLLRIWRDGSKQIQDQNVTPNPIEAEAHALARWVGEQLDRMEPGEPSRVPLLCALVLASWGEHRLPSLDARSFFAPEGGDTLWLAFRLAEEIADLVRGQTLWELATRRWQAVQDLVWLARGVRARPSVSAWDRQRLFPWPPTLPWFDGLDRLRAILEAATQHGEEGLTPDTILPLRTLADFQRYASTLQARPELIDVHAIDGFPLSHLLSAIGVPRRLQGPVPRKGLDVLWRFAEHGARERYVTGLLRELAGVWAPMGEEPPALRTGQEKLPLRWRLLMIVRRRTVMLDLGPCVDVVRLRSKGGLWRVELLGSVGGQVASEVRYRIEARAVMGEPVEIVVRLGDGSRVAEVSATRADGRALSVRVLGCWRDSPRGRWEGGEGARSLPI